MLWVRANNVTVLRNISYYITLSCNVFCSLTTSDIFLKHSWKKNSVDSSILDNMDENAMDPGKS